MRRWQRDPEKAVAGATALQGAYGAGQVKHLPAMKRFSAPCKAPPFQTRGEKSRLETSWNRPLHAWFQASGTHSTQRTQASVARACLLGPRHSVSNSRLFIGWHTHAVNSQPAPPLLFGGIHPRVLSKLRRPVLEVCGSSPIDNKKARTYRTGPRYTCSWIQGRTTL
jgi:hypothetical protein